MIRRPSLFQTQPNPALLSFHNYSGKRSLPEKTLPHSSWRPADQLFLLSPCYPSHRAYPILLNRSNANGSGFGNLLDTRHARVLNPRPSVAFGVQKAETHTHRVPSRVARLGW